MEALINVQKDLKKSIEKALINFKKSPKDRLSEDYIEIRIDNLEKDWDLFRRNNTKLYEISKPPELDSSIYVKNDMYDQTEESYIVCKTHMRTVLKQVTASKNTSNSSQSMSKHSNSHVKLPKLSIPLYSGKYSEWTSFRNLFISLVHKNEALDNVQKLHYLKTHLTGEAELLIRHMPITESNYIQCWSQLEKRYNNKRYLANCILKRLFGQRRLNVETASALKDLLDTTTDCLSALGNLNIDVSTWDVIIIHIVTFKLDNESRKQWELSISGTGNDGNELPTFEQFKAFLEGRFRALEFIEPKRTLVQHSNGSHSQNSRALVATGNFNIRCEYCSESHKLCFCKKFSRQDTNVRRDFVAKNNICFNCLGSNHTVYECKKTLNCRICKKRHHSLLHPPTDSTERQKHSNPIIDDASPTSSNAPIISCVSTSRVVKTGQVLLPTALIKAESKSGEFQFIRALLDQGSQACFITEAAVQFLRLKKYPVRGTISGIGNGKTIMATHMVNTTVQSRVDGNFKMKISAYVLKNITSFLPERKIDSCDWLDTTDLYLADPHFNTPNKIDILLGAEIVSYILKEGIKKSPAGRLTAQNTSLGWILSGVIESSRSDNLNGIAVSVMHAHVSEDEMLKRFWEVEEQSSNMGKILTEEEQRCEEIYKETTTRTEKGRYMVKLPFRNSELLCTNGNSRQIAIKRLNSLENRLAKDKDLKEKYTDVIKNYLHLDHMRPVRENEMKKEEAVYLPHHPVVRNDKTTSQVRVVFNASCPNSKGISLNDNLMVGATLQADLRHIILRWRVHPIALVADIIKMYRQVRVADEDAIFQRIVWRDNPKEEIRDYELITVTFGTASAPFLAVRTLHQIAYDEGQKYPHAADNILNCFYMDDLMTGASTVEEGTELYRNITDILKKGGFQLQKWNSNNQELIKEITTYERHGKDNIERKGKTLTKEGNEDNETKDNLSKDNQRNAGQEENMEHKITSKLDSTIKILGLTWDRSEDHFQYTVQLPTISGPITKRLILSDIARLFDPLGGIAPAIILAKMFIQKLWLSGVGWDDVVPSELLNEWLTCRSELPQLTKVRIPRWLGTKKGETNVELHGFSDASKLAYAAVVYVRVLNTNDQVHTSLLVAKTRVAPVKQISIPRLELCGAVLVAKLLNEVMSVLNIGKDKVKAWTDSTIVLAWLNSHPSRWKTFVGNRVSEILGLLDVSQWHYVSSKENPADCASRGIQPALLSDNKLWAVGPQFLQKPIIDYNRPNNLITHLEENIKTHAATVTEESLFLRFSSLQKLLRVVSYCRRFLTKNRTFTKHIQKKELDTALQSCIRLAQQEEFQEEYKLLVQNNGVFEIKSGKLKSLCPYLDNDGLIRVSGRLHKSHLDEQTKHPIVLPHSSHLTRLLIVDAHNKTLHGGVQLMMNYLRTGYWIIGARSLLKQHVHRCVRCIRQRANVKYPFMGSLPSSRCSPARAFNKSGVDYAGPINIRISKGRGNKSYKGYICLFVCMVTKAIHLEVVSDMTSQAFLAAFRRFVSRRGHCSQLWSDNGSTFVGAYKELNQLASIQQSVVSSLEANGTEWHFIPPHAPNFGGLWEAGVKATKFHLKRVLGDSTLTYEEMSTLLCQVEACLNSRPITFLNTTDPAEPAALTPGHFLVGEPLLSIPDVNYENSRMTSLTRWQLIQKMLQNFWRRWSNEYLSLLVQRYKWTSHIPEPKINDVVLIKGDDLPPSQWLLGRIIEVHSGHDNTTRVVTLRTKSSIIKRPVSKLCMLPIAE